MTERLTIDEDVLDTRWVDDEDPFESDERSATYPPSSLVTFRFLFDAVRRHYKLWLAVAVFGLAVGLAVPVLMPPPAESSTKLLLTHRDGDDPARAMATDVSMLSTHTIAKRAIDRLGLDVTADDLLKQYSAVALTDRVLQINVGAKTGTEANRLAAALADIYLKFRRDQITLQEVPLRKDLQEAKDTVAEAKADLVAAGGNPNDPAPPPTPEATRYTTAREKQRYIEQQILDQQVSASKMNSSRVMDAAALVPQSSRKTMAISVGAGTLAGLFFGIGFVVVRALVSDKLWRRRDIATSIGGRVPLSIGRPPRWRLRPFPRYLRRAQTEKPAVRMVVRHLRSQLRWGESPKPALIVVAVDDIEASALITASLAMSYAEEGKKVLAADLSGSRALADTLGVETPGTHDSRFSGPDLSLAVFLPDDDTGPVEGRHLLRGGAATTVSADDPMAKAWAEADVVLTLATPSASIGADHLRTWASQATAIVTAGRSSATAVHSAGELLRLAEIRLASTVLLRADRTDDSVGAIEGEVLPPKAEAGVEMITR